MKNHEESFTELCLKNDWRRTPQRQAVFEFMCNNLTHPSVDDVWKSVRKNVPSVTRESIYRILNEFAEAGIIARIDKIESARYDCTTQPHGHFVCDRCKQIFDFPLPETFTLPEQFAEQELSHIELRLAGLCPECRKKVNNGRQNDVNTRELHDEDSFANNKQRKEYNNGSEGK